MIKSFMIDHTKLKPGLYVSRIDDCGSEKITTFDIRVCKPNKDMLTPSVSHTIEHLMADYMRNNSIYRDRVLYFGPMGCLTGFYLILKGEWTSAMAVAEIAKSFHACSEAKSIPGSSETECGNCHLIDLNSAVSVCKEFSLYLQNIPSDCLIYPG